MLISIPLRTHNTETGHQVSFDLLHKTEQKQRKPEKQVHFILQATVAATKMRPAPLPAVAAAQHLIHFTSSQSSLSPLPLTSSSSTTSSLGDFRAYATIAVIFLLCALICALALHGAVRCFLCHQPPHEEEPRPVKDVGEAVATPICPGPAVTFLPGMDMAGTGECAICLAEFTEGEEIQLIAECRHGFHAQCIERWLSSHSSCPNCRRSCLAANANVDAAAQAPVTVLGQWHV